jgi:hypothetical protein
VKYGFLKSSDSSASKHFDFHFLWTKRAGGPRPWRRPPRLPLHHATALQHWWYAACADADVMLRGHQGPRRSARPMLSLLGFRTVRRDGRIQALGRFHIGGVAYCVWAFPPNAGGAAHRHVQAHSCHVEYPTVADAVIEPVFPSSIVAHRHMYLSKSNFIFPCSAPTNGQERIMKKHMLKYILIVFIA